MIKKEVEIFNHSSNFALNNIASTIYTDEDLNIALAAVEAFQEHASQFQQPQIQQFVPPPTEVYSPSPSEDKISHYISMRFRDEEKKFSGALGECWGEYISEYSYASKDYSLSETQKQQYLHHLLRGNAKRFFSHRVEGVAKSYAESCVLMEKEYNSVSRQNRVGAYLRNLRVSKYITPDCAVNDALEKVHEEISKLTPQGPSHCRLEKHKMEYLQNAVIGYPWAKEACSRANAGLLKYHEFYNQLESAVQLEQEEKVGRLRDQKHLRLTSVMNDDPVLRSRISDTYYNGQPRYAKEPQPWRKTQRPSQERRFRPNIICWGCRKPGHILSDCTEPTLQNVAKKVQYYQKNKFEDPHKATKRVLFELCQELDKEEELVSPEEEYEDADTFFCDVNESFDTGGATEEPSEVAEQLFARTISARSQEPSLTDCFEDF